MSEEGVCYKCPNRFYCYTYRKYGEVYTKKECIDLASKERYGFTIEEQIKKLRKEK